MTASTVLDTARDVSEAYVAAAQHARRNAQSWRRSAAFWPEEHADWASQDIAKAHEAYEAAIGHLKKARKVQGK